MGIGKGEAFVMKEFRCQGQLFLNDSSGGFAWLRLLRYRWVSMGLHIEILTGGELTDQVVQALAGLRIEVFREWPYLYEGDQASEEEYLANYRTAQGAVVVAAKDDETFVGASTGMPLAEEHAEFIAPFPKLGYDPAEVFYCAESVLRKSYRGQGTGHRFFDAREAHARRLGGFRYVTFCGVVRPENHPQRPPDYLPLNAFWTKRGYAPVEGLVTKFPWKEIGKSEESLQTMQFWLRELD